MTLNMNNELNARFHRNAVIELVKEFKDVGDKMQNMLDLPYWGDTEENEYDKLKANHQSVLNRLKMAGMFL